MNTDAIAEAALIDLSRHQRETKWSIDANGNWAQRPMVRARVGNGWIEFPASPHHAAARSEPTDGR